MFDTRRKKLYSRQKPQNCKRVKSLDLFAKPIGLTFKGESKFRTVLGSVFSLMALSFVALYAGFRLLPILSDEKTKINQNTMDITDNNTFIKEQKPEWMIGKEIHPEILFAIGIGDDLLGPEFGQFYIT